MKSCAPLMAEPEGIVCVPGFLTTDESRLVYRALRDSLSWQQRVIRFYGKSYPQPRLLAWIGETPFAYSGMTLQAEPWPEVLWSVRQRVEERVLGRSAGEYRGALVSYYRDGLDSIGFHDEPQAEAPAVLLSLGATRVLRLVQRGGAARELSLEDGSLLVLQEAARAWQRGIPREPRVREGCIQVTFRKQED